MLILAKGLRFRHFATGILGLKQCPEYVLESIQKVTESPYIHSDPRNLSCISRRGASTFCRVFFYRQRRLGDMKVDFVTLNGTLYICYARI